MADIRDVSGVGSNEFSGSRQDQRGSGSAVPSAGIERDRIDPTQMQSAHNIMGAMTFITE
jgi:hypothetical protein